METPENLKKYKIPNVRVPSSLSQGISGLLDKLLATIVWYLKTYIKDDWDFLWYLPCRVDCPYTLASCDVVSLYTSIHEDTIHKSTHWPYHVRENNVAIITVVISVALHSLVYPYNNQTSKNVRSTRSIISLEVIISSSQLGHMSNIDDFISIF